MSQEKRKQGVRLIFVFVYVGLLFIVNKLAFGSWIPFAGDKGLWFYSSAASIILGNLLVTPFYTKPVDALSYSVLAGTGIYFTSNFTKWGTIDLVIFWSALGFIGFVLLVSLITIATKDSEKKLWKKLSQTCIIIANYCGNHRVIFSVVFLFALIVYHRDSTKVMFLLSVSWEILVVVEPDKQIWNMLIRIKGIWSKDWLINEVGFISAYQTPRIILIRQNENVKTNFGTVLAYKDSHNTTKVGIVLNYVGRDENLLLRAIDVNVSKDVIEKATTTIKKSASNTVVYFDYFNQNKGKKEEVTELKQLDEIIGIVDQDTTVERLEFEVIKDEDLSEGRLVEVEIQRKTVLYQIMDGLTKEDIVSQKNKYGYARATAVKIGKWNESKKKFEPAKWLPNINTPVYLKKATTPQLDADAVGHFPKTKFNVQIKNVNELITHNTAILGILGIGKSMLSIELVERMITQGIKVICIDLTNQYANLLSDFYSKEREEKKLKELYDLGLKGKTSVSLNVEEGGSLNNVRRAIDSDLESFIDKTNPINLKIYNPAKFEVWRQDSKPYNNKASMVLLTPTEITQIISECALEICQQQGMTDIARVCLVYEEAHSLVPEWNSVACDGDKAATNGTARAILQGRKYGLGCLLITQRTANVTKTILNQCNSIFAMRTFDETSKAFLSNYIGSIYTNRLSSLESRQAVFYGKASSCENPVLLRLNDRKDFLKSFREINPPPELPLKEKKEGNEKEMKIESNDKVIVETKITDDDVPF